MTLNADTRKSYLREVRYAGKKIFTGKKRGNLTLTKEYYLSLK